MSDDQGSDHQASSHAESDHHERARSAVEGMSEDERLWCLDGDGPFWAGTADLAVGGYHKSPFPAARVERLGLQGFSFSDGPRGVVVDRATCFPVSMARGATWDVDLEERIGEAIGLELRAVGADLYGGVCVNLLRHPAWGRAQETYGEDPHHVGELGAALTRGVQRHAMACVKHFACNSMENARFKVDITVDEEALHDVYLPHFRRIVDEGVAVVMSAYNSVNGDWCAESSNLLTEVLRNEWGFDGFVISDWIFGLRNAPRSLRAGLDVEMPYRMVRASNLRDAIRDGEVTWAEVDRATERVVATRMRFDEILKTPAPDIEVLACPGHRALAREAAAKSVVLLRNMPVEGTPLLPLDPASLRSIALVGRLATEVNLGDGGSSDVWPPEVVTIFDGLTSALPNAEVVTDDGSDTTRAATLARSADVAIVVVGYTCIDEGEFAGPEAMANLSFLFPGPDDPALVEAFEKAVSRRREVSPPAHVAERVTIAGFVSGGDRKSLRLHAEDVDLVNEVAAANPRTIVVIVAGSAVLMSEWDYKVPAIVSSWYSGMEGGHGLADVLLGYSDASGRLPFSVPVKEADLPAFDAEAESFGYDRWHGWWHLEHINSMPAYPFGFGLSYTTFSVADCEIEKRGRELLVRATLHNTGLRSGTDVVQVYAHRQGSDSPSRLVGFARVDVAAGESSPVTIVVPLTRLAVRDASSHTMVVVPGNYILRVARHACDPGSQLEVTVDKEQSLTRG
jgi:beta-glucosidase